MGGGVGGASPLPPSLPPAHHSDLPPRASGDDCRLLLQLPALTARRRCRRCSGRPPPPYTSPTHTPYHHHHLLPALLPARSQSSDADPGGCGLQEENTASTRRLPRVCRASVTSAHSVSLEEEVVVGVGRSSQEEY